MPTTILVQGREYRLQSQNKGEYAGPCLFTGMGDDRFRIWPAEERWYCRKECSNCPGVRAGVGGMTGSLKDQQVPQIAPVSQTSLPSMDRVLEYHDGLSRSALDYLASRGIRDDTTRRFLIGTNCRRLTVPLIVNNGGPHCYGIKKRWIGQPPEPWIETYTMEPGSQGLSIFNYDRLTSRRQWDYVLIVEGVLDCVLLDQLGIPATAPFGGGGVWDPKWARAYRNVQLPIVVADWDKPNDQGKRAGTAHALRKLKSLPHGVMVFPPGGYKDIGEAFLGGENIRDWITSLRSS